MDFHSAAQWLDEVEGCSMPALQIKPEEIGTVDLARYQAIRQKMWAKPAPVPEIVLQVVAPVPEPAPDTFPPHSRTQPAPFSRSLLEYLAKDRSFDKAGEGGTRQRPILLREIIAIVCDAYNIEPTCIKGQRRTKEVVSIRHEAMWLCKKFTERSLPEIGRAIGGRDHTTVLHAVRKMQALVAAGEYVPRALPAVQKAVDALSGPPAAMLSEA
jgi:hypothetical protein